MRPAQLTWPRVLERQRQSLLQGQLLLVHGTLQREEDVIHVIVGKVKDCSDWLGGMEVRGRNFADGIRTTRTPADGVRHRLLAPSTRFAAISGRALLRDHFSGHEQHGQPDQCKSRPVQHLERPQIV